MPILSRWPRQAGLCRAGFLLLFTLGAGCSSLAPEHFAGTRPVFDPVVFFTGRTHSWGVFENRGGDPTRRFTTTATGHREGDTLVLDQEFIYEDGHRQQRRWQIRHTDACHIEATASDVVGTATGEAEGNAFRWEYTVALQPGNPLYNVHLKQWMYLQAGGRTLLNRATITKFGVEVAQVTEFFQRESPYSRAGGNKNPNTSASRAAQAASVCCPPPASW